MSKHSDSAKPKRRFFAPALIAAGIAGTALLSLSMTGTLSAFTAAITNSVNTASSGSIVLQEVNGSNTCNSTDTTVANVAANSSTCSTINKYGAQTGMVPGGTGTPVVLAFKNLGTSAAATFTMKFNGCTQTAIGSYQGGATDFCNKLNVKVYAGSVATGTPVITGTATSLASSTNTLATIPTAGGAAVNYTVVASLDSSADNTYQGYQAAQSIVWTLSS